MLTSSGTFPYRPLGPLPNEDTQRRFRVWAPRVKQVQLVLLSSDNEEVVELEEEGFGYYLSAPVTAPEGTKYGYRLDGDKVAYPALIPEMRFYGPTPTTGTVRCEVRPKEQKMKEAEERKRSS